MEPFQTTLATRVEFKGVGLHKGGFATVEIEPAETNSGICFVRTDLLHKPRIVASPSSIVSTNLCTTIGNYNGDTVSTIEHLMASFVGLGIDNAIVKINSCEVPIMDGSSFDFVKRFKEAGIVTQDRRKNNYEIKESISVGSSPQFIKYEPSAPQDKRSLLIECVIEFPDTAIGLQKLSFELKKDSFLEIYKARTFCRYEWINKMQAQGYALGGSLKNAVVVKKDTILNEEGVRYQDEFVRHKVLDCIGDIGLLGFSLYGKLTVHRGGHTINAEFVRKVWEHIQSELITSDNSSNLCQIS
jgi:UDP-3-O-[3-hydroxymyristoyl] N-acetylglucosamine deacetylase